MNKEQLVHDYPLGYELKTVAKIAKVHRNTVAYAVENGQLFTYQAENGRPKVSPDEVLRWMEWRKTAVRKRSRTVNN